MAESVEVLDIDLSKLQDDAENTGKTLADLRKEVKDLKATLEGTEIESKDFSKALTNLTKKQQELANVTKSGNKAVEGSYNKLVNQMALLKQQWRSTGDEVERAKLGEQIDKINTELKELDSSIGNNQRNVGNYKLALKNLKTELYGLEEGTEEYNQKLQEASELYIKMHDVNEFVAGSAADSGEIMQNAIGVAGAMVGAFQSVEASLQLFGIESEEVTKSIQKMQSLMAITQGLTALEGGIDAYKRLNAVIKQSTLYTNLFGASTKSATVAQHGLNAAMKANPLGIILTVITALVSAYAVFGDKLKKTEKIQRTMNDATEKANTLHSETIRILDNEDKVRKALGETEEQQIRRRIQFLKYGASRKRIEELKEETAALVAAYDVEEAMGKKHSDEQREAQEKNKEALKSLTDQIKDMDDEIAALDTDLQVIMIENAKKVAEDRKKKAEETSKTIQKTHEEGMKEYEKKTDETIKSIQAKEKAALDLSVKMQEEAEKQKMESVENTAAVVDLEYSNMIDLTSKLYNEQIKTAEKSGDIVGASQLKEESIDNEIGLIQEQIETYQKYGLECTELILALNDLREAREQAADDTMAAKEQESLQKSKEVMDASIGSINAFSVALQGLVASGEGLFSNEELSALNEGLMGLSNTFGIIKQGMDEIGEATDKNAAKWQNYGNAAAAGFASAAAMLNSFAAAQKQKIAEMGEDEYEAKLDAFEKQKKYSIAAAVTSTLSGIASAWASCMQLGPIAGPIAAGALSALMTGIGYAQVKQIKSTTFEDAYGKSGNTTASAAASQPSLTALQQMTPGVQATTNIEGASAEGKIKDTKVYVTETDISKTINNVKTTVEEATF